MRTTRPFQGLLVLALVAGVASGCGGSTEESNTNPGGGSIVDSALPDSEPEAAAAEAGLDAEPDVEPLDASVDQSVDDVAAPDAEPSEASLFDLTMPDVSLNDSGATVQSCYDCAAAQCTSNMAECEQDDACRTLVLCLFTEGCIDGSGMGGVDSNCAFGCVSAAGITSFSDPAVQVALGVASCVNSNCQGACALPDGGLSLDGGP